MKDLIHRIIHRIIHGYFAACPYCGYEGGGWPDSGRCPDCGETS